MFFESRISYTTTYVILPRARDLLVDTVRGWQDI